MTYLLWFAVAETKAPVGESIRPILLKEGTRLVYLLSFII